MMKRSSKKLSLNRQTLRQLDQMDMANVAGGALCSGTGTFCSSMYPNKPTHICYSYDCTSEAC